MQLFNVPAGKRVRIRAKLVRWVDAGIEHIIGEDLTWEGRTTDKYYNFQGTKRRLIVDHNIKGWKQMGIWQRDIEVEVLD